jgi:2-polyprenyl-6-methoxyphenol hydroxylase-like FAD-dependent oxidoreductase
MFNKKKSDIVVLGAGPVGLTAAHALHRRGADYVLLDRGRRTHTHSYALALHPGTLDLLDSLDLAGPVLEKARRITRVALYEGAAEKAVLDYGKLPGKHPFIAVIAQGELESVLAGELGVRKAHKPLWNHRARFVDAVPDGLDVSVDRLEESMTGYAVAHIDMQVDKVLHFQTRHLLGADGHESIARRIAGIDFPQTAPHSDYAVFEFKTDANLADEMRLIIDGERTHVFWPLPGGYCRWSFQVAPDEAPVDSLEKDHLLVQFGDSGFPLLDREHLDGFLARHAPWFKGSVERLRWRMMVRFQQRLASAFGNGRIWLAGDAAHMAPPAGMLSMNVGMREVADLVDRLGEADDAKRQAALQDYDAERRAEWKRLLDGGAGIVAGKDADPWVAKHKDRLAGNIPATGATLDALLKQAGLSAGSA